MHNFTKWAVSIIAGAAAAFFGQYGIMIAIAPWSTYVSKIKGISELPV